MSITGETDLMGDGSEGGGSLPGSRFRGDGTRPPGVDARAAWGLAETLGESPAGRVVGAVPVVGRDRGT